MIFSKIAYPMGPTHIYGKEDAPIGLEPASRTSMELVSTSKISHESFRLASKIHIKILDLPTKLNYLFGFASSNENPECATRLSHQEFLRTREALLIQFCYWKLGYFRSLY